MTALAFDRSAAFAARPSSDDAPIEMTPDVLMDIADHAMRSVLRGWHSDDDCADAAQTAALKLWQAYLRYGPKHRGYYFQVARHAICEWLNKQRPAEQETSIDPLEWRLYAPENEHVKPWIDEDTLRGLAPEMGLNECEIVYLIHRLAGRGHIAIAHEMNLTVQAVENTQRRVLLRLRRLADGLPPTSAPQSPRYDDAIGNQMNRWRAIELPWAEIGRRLNLSAKAAESVYRRWCKRELQKQFA